MTYIVLDLEWNQPYSKTKKYAGGVALAGEIIQFGAVKLANDFSISETFNESVRPRYYKHINRHVKNITGITDDMLLGCDGFLPVFERFLKFCGTDFAIITWGIDDISMLKNNMQAYGISPRLLKKFYNLQVMFNMQITHQSRQFSLDNAAQILGLSENSHPHNAFYDALTTADIAKSLDFEKAVKEYDAMGSADGTKTAVFDGFKSARLALGDTKVLSTTCPICNKNLKCSKWQSGKYTRTAIANCKIHGSFKYKVTVYKNEQGFSAKKKIAYPVLEKIT